MDVVDYFSKMNKGCQEVFSETINSPKQFGLVHDLSSNLYEWAEVIENEEESDLLKNVGVQIEISALILSVGLYRQAFFSLRLALELLLGTVYFSINKLEQMEWMKSKGDINWSKLIDSDNGILSKRFASAFFPELKEEVVSFNKKTKSIYRKLSEHVHGNYVTWEKDKPIIKKNARLIKQYFIYLNEIKEITFFVLVCRYLKFISKEKQDHIYESCVELNYIEAIRCYLGGPKEL